MGDDWVAQQLFLPSSKNVQIIKVRRSLSEGTAANPMVPMVGDTCPLDSDRLLKETKQIFVESTSNTHANKAIHADVRH